ncbi:hypothetical protein HPB47_026020 [Ixodes persulcatus]|uniref:Uncharacterized protein n=1 Tax=Ixodes persulcatus TaxID=34615 RepID=A0AC60Q1W3_IXOPE|nr:hypothetical protein HPB47_026020 [Ixodes persulcatus]
MCASLPGDAPYFVREPPARLRFVNSTGGALFCAAKGHPTPDIRWVTVESEVRAESRPALDIPGLRRLQPDGTIVFEPFRAEQYRQDVHSAVYRCTAANRVGVLGSRDVQVRAGECRVGCFVLFVNYPVCTLNLTNTLGF